MEAAGNKLQQEARGYLDALRGKFPMGHLGFEAGSMLK